MLDFIGQITLVNILSVLLLLASIWLLVIIMQKKIGYMFRGMVFFLFVLLALLYFQKSDVKKYTLNDLKNALFPKKNFVLNYHIEEESYRGTIVRYVFDEPLPRIPVSMDKEGKYFHITNITVLNEILGRMRLPPVKNGVKEYASITGSNAHKNLYKWEDYSRGILILERTLCKNRQTLETFNCLVSITIRQRYQE